MGSGTFLVLVSVLFLVASVLLVSGGDVMVVRADVVDSGDQGENITSTVSIEVPDSLDFGTIDERGTSEELKVYINNTGSLPVIVRPEIISGDEEIFSNLYFREYKTSGGVQVVPKKVGDFSFNISAPSAGYTSKSKYVYVQLDLSNSGIDLSTSLMGRSANVRFIAVAQ